MKLVILGATGPTGRQLVSQALQNGHDVAVVVRNPSRLKEKHERLQVTTGDIFNIDLAEVFTDKDVVLSSLGVGKSLKSNNLMTRAVAVIIPAMQQAGIKRIIFMSAFGVGRSIEQASFIQKLIFRTILKNIYNDKAIADEKLSNSELDWTLVRPVVLTNGNRTGKYKPEEAIQMKGMPKISRADVADFMIKEAVNNRWSRRAVVLR